MSDASEVQKSPIQKISAIKEKLNFRKNKAEKKKEIDRQLEELLVSANVEPSIGSTPETKQYASHGSPFTSISMAAGKMFKPAHKESRVIDDQLNSLIVESEGVINGPVKPQNKEPVRPLIKEPVKPELNPIRVEKIADYKEIKPLTAIDKQELTEMVNDVKVFAAKYKEGANGSLKEPAASSPITDDDLRKYSISGNVPGSDGKPEQPLISPAQAPTVPVPEVKAMPSAQIQAPSIDAVNKDPLKMDFTDDILSLLKDTAKIQKDDKSLEIMRDMKGRQVTCSELEEDMANLMMVFKQSKSRNNKRTRV
jgi:hypothetical protein